MKQILFFLLIICCSCHTADKNRDDAIIRVSKFPVEMELTADIITIPPVAMTPFNIFITDDKLVMFNMMKDSIFDIFSLPECTYLFSTGYKGEGPNDFFDIDRRLFVPTSNGFKLFFQTHKELKQVAFREKSLEIIKDSTLKFDIDQSPVNGFTPLNDTTYIYWSGFDKETEYDLLNTEIQETMQFSPYPNWTEIKLPEDKLFSYIKNMAVRPDGKMFAAFYGYFKRFRVYDHKGILLKDISLEIEPYSKEIEPNLSDRMVYYFAYPKASNKYIYALCKNAKSDAVIAPELQIWTWDGVSVAKYKLDRPISLFSVSEKHQKIYAINGEYEEEVYVYSLPEALL